MFVYTPVYVKTTDDIQITNGRSKGIPSQVFVAWEPSEEAEEERAEGGEGVLGEEEASVAGWRRQEES